MLAGWASTRRFLPALVMVVLGIALELVRHGVDEWSQPLSPFLPLMWLLWLLSQVPLLDRLLETIGWAVFIKAPYIFFWGWCLPLFWGSKVYPRRSLVLLIATVVLSVAWYTLALSAIGLGWWWCTVWYALPSALLMVGAIGCAIWCRRRPSFWQNALAHWIWFAWLWTYAFAWIGERT